MLASGDNVDCKPTVPRRCPIRMVLLVIIYYSKVIELANAEIEKVSHLSKKQYTCTCTCTHKLFYLLATNHVSVYGVILNYAS